eukprot:gnl/MRDRNA2_/MRDRNA2_77221_c0_seq1.p1 gnl/MRDRNA2_/MRDRNA2_77221_c0~~gnl/MRDRNA2_/MRDRNA2_77221_c0_seq1.p1  ORF type:complete len:1212 (-),score=226.25 gnl/MRDRNA2_/MRDRNA2_77221_c0_seq1:22-3657(-)
MVDAAEGPPRKGAVGVVVANDGTSTPIGVSFAGRTWWCQSRALHLVGSDPNANTGGQCFTFCLQVAAPAKHMVQCVLQSPNHLDQVVSGEFTSFGANGDGELQIEEFVNFMAKMSGEYGFPEPSESRNIAEFRQHDRDGSNSLSREEFAECFKSLLFSICPMKLPKSALIKESKPGEKIWDFYVKGKKLGRGAFGTCWRAVEKATGVDVVVKKLHLPAMEGNEIRRETGLEEFRLVRELSHPNVLRVFGVFDHGSSVYIVTEFARSGDLYKYINKHQQEGRSWITERFSAGVVNQVLKALAYCHGRKVLHHDIKPDNILIMSDDDGSYPEFTVQDPHVVVGDWGQATFIRAEGVSSANYNFGDSRYIPPEMCECRSGPKSDVYMLGMTLCELLVGERRLPDFNECTRQATSLCGLMIEKEYDARASVSQCLQHAWFKSACAPLQRAATIEVQDAAMRLCKHAQGSTLKKMARNIFAAQLGSEWLQRARSLFEALDTDGNGTLSRAELCGAFGRLGIGDEAAARLFMEMAADGEEIDFNTWVAATMDFDDMDEEYVVAKLHQMFVEADVSHRGIVSKQDLFGNFLNGLEDEDRKVFEDSLAFTLGDSTEISLSAWGRYMGVENLAEQVSKAAEERLTLAVQDLQGLQFSPKQTPVAASRIALSAAPCHVTVMYPPDMRIGDEIAEWNIETVKGGTDISIAEFANSRGPAQDGGVGIGWKLSQYSLHPSMSQQNHALKRRQTVDHCEAPAKVNWIAAHFNELTDVKVKFESPSGPALYATCTCNVWSVNQDLDNSIVLKIDAFRRGPQDDPTHSTLVVKDTGIEIFPSRVDISESSNAHVSGHLMFPTNPEILHGLQSGNLLFRFAGPQYSSVVLPSCKTHDQSTTSKKRFNPAPRPVLVEAGMGPQTLVSGISEPIDIEIQASMQAQGSTSIVLAFADGRQYEILSHFGEVSLYRCTSDTDQENVMVLSSEAFVKDNFTFRIMYAQRDLVVYQKFALPMLSGYLRLMNFSEGLFTSWTGKSKNLQAVKENCSTWIVSNLGYDDGEDAEIHFSAEAGHAALLTFVHFSTEELCDYIEISGQRYSGKRTPPETEVPAGSTTKMRWHSDNVWNRKSSGWVCKLQLQGTPKPIGKLLSPCCVTIEAFSAEAQCSVLHGVSLPELGDSWCADAFRDAAKTLQNARLKIVEELEAVRIDCTADTIQVLNQSIGRCMDE